MKKKIKCTFNYEQTNKQQQQQKRKIFYSSAGNFKRKREGNNKKFKNENNNNNKKGLNVFFSFIHSVQFSLHAYLFMGCELKIQHGIGMIRAHFFFLSFFFFG